MGLLDAWINAEKIWYPVVWEKKKDSDNVIDYDIREEITIDWSSVFNANNDTTTGMATVIPWVNAPKLIASTSIYWDLSSPIWWVNISWTLMLQHPDDPSKSLKSWTMSDEWGWLWFSVTSDWLKIPETWRYQFDINYPLWWSNRYLVTDIRYIRGWGASEDLIYHTWQASSNQETETKKVELKKWDLLYAVITLHYIGSSSSFLTYADLSIKITKL